MKAVISVGNPLKGDDNIANLVIEKLKQKPKQRSVLFLRGEANPENLIGVLQKIGPTEIVFVDALFFGDAVGEVKRFALDELQSFFPSTHSIPVSVFKKFFPKTKICVIGIEPKRIEPSTKLSKELERSFEEIAANVSGLI